MKYSFRLVDLVTLTKRVKGQPKYSVGTKAIVVGRDKDSDSFYLHIAGHGETAKPVSAKALELVSSNASDLLEQWEQGDYSVEQKALALLRNFTAILPTTCNAACSFCPEKEMEDKAPRAVWQTGLIHSLNKYRDHVDHLSISGGEPSLVTRLLFDTIDRVRAETHIEKIGITTNGHFLESRDKTFEFLDANTTRDMKSKLSHLNISMHSFDRELANEIMGVKYKYTLADLVRFRRQLGTDVSFHINFVLTDKTDYQKEFNAAKEFLIEHPYIDVVFRVDYNDAELSQRLRLYANSLNKYKEKLAENSRRPSKSIIRAPKKPELLAMFDETFDAQESEDDSWTTGCPSCFTHASPTINNGRAFLKASSYEPNDDEDVMTEMVYHMDGKLYFDWSRNTPVGSKVTFDGDEQSISFESLRAKDEDELRELCMQLELAPKRKLKKLDEEDLLELLCEHYGYDNTDDDEDEEDFDDAEESPASRVAEPPYRGCGYGLNRCGY